MSWTDTRTRGPRVDARAVVLFVVLDVLTYAVVYWLLVPALDVVLQVLEETTATALGWVLSAVRLTLVGVVVARSYRRRHGFDERVAVVPTLVTAALSAWAVQLALGVGAALALGTPPWSWRVLLDLVLWVGFALLALLFVAPGEAERLPLRYARGDRGATNLLIIPVVAGLLAATLLIIGVVGSATSDATEAGTAADAAALGAAGVWRDAVEDAFAAGAGASEESGFWAFAGSDLGSLASPSMVEAARAYARENGAELVSVDVSPDRAQVTVHVRSREVVPESGRRMTAEATAELDLRGGVCRTGRVLGYLVGGTCRTSAPPAPPAPEPEPEPEPTEGTEPTPSPTPTPFDPPAVGAVDVATRLVAS